MKKYQKEIGTLNSADMKFSTFREIANLSGKAIATNYFSYLLHTNDFTNT